MPPVDWWARFKRRLFPGAAKGGDNGASGNPLIIAQCTSAEVSNAMIAISEVRPHGAAFKARVQFRPGARVTIRVPSKTDDRGAIPIKAVILDCRLIDPAASEYAAEVRFTESTNAGRDRWVGSLLGTHGITLTESDEAPGERRRGGDRYATSLPLRLRVGPRLVSGYVRNISLGGMLALVDGEVAEDTLAVFELQLPGTRHLLKLNGRVVHLEPGDGDAFSVIGVCFEALPPDQEDLLTVGVRAIAREAGRKKGI